MINDNIGSETCKHFAITYRKTADYFKNRKDIIFTKLNFVHNDSPIHIQHLPTLILYFKGTGKQFEKYHGILHQKYLIEWIEKNLNIVNNTMSNDLQFEK